MAVAVETMQPVPGLTPEEYLEQDRRAERRSEYRDGEIIAITHQDGYPGASLAHNRITANLVRHLGNQLDGAPCEAFAQDMRTRTAPTRYSYPDVVIVCGEPEFLDERQDVITNPTVIIEVLSDSTEAYDRGEKFAGYQRRESFREYVLIAQNRCSVEHYTRQEGGLWLYERLDRLDARLNLPSAGCELALSDIYYRVNVGAESAKE